MIYGVVVTYVETVRGGDRRFEHELAVEAPDALEARWRAEAFFEQVALESWVGWARKLEEVRVLGPALPSEHGREDEGPSHRAEADGPSRPEETTG